MGRADRLYPGALEARMTDPKSADIELNADLFMRRMLRELSGQLQEVVGVKEAEGFINSVGAAMGTWIEQIYRDEMGSADLDPAQVAEIFVDLKRRIGGAFRVTEVRDDRIVVSNGRCPFGEMAEGRDSLCMMTSNVFGRIAADHLGYARVELHNTIARGDKECRIVVHLKRDGRDVTAREYFRSRELAEH